MRLETPDHARGGFGARFFPRLSLRQWTSLGLALAALALCGWQSWRLIESRRSFARGKMEPPPEVLEARRLRGSPFAPGLTREERKEAFKKYGHDFWQRTTAREKIEVARGYFPRLMEKMELSAEQQAPAQRVLENAVGELIPVWEGWWDPQFGHAGALLRTWIIAAKTRQQLDPILNAAQKERIDAWMKQAQQRNADAATSSTTPTAPRADS